jgi:hypothetical protein
MEWLNKLLSNGTTGIVSSKRVVTILAFILCAVEFITELYTGNKVSEHTLDSMMYIVIAGLGFTASEKFTKKD